MAFNANAYYRNQARRDAIEALSRARRIKAGLERTHGDSAYWLESAVRHARINWRLYCIRKAGCELEREYHNANRPPHKHKAPYRPAAFTTRLGVDHASNF